MPRQYYPERVENFFKLARLPEIQDFFRDFNTSLSEASSSLTGLNQLTGVTVYEDKKNHLFVVEAQLPGLSLKNIQVTFENGVISIQGRKEEEEEETHSKDREYYRRALNTTFSYQVTLPIGQIDEKAEPQATYKDGVLKVTFKKTKQTQAKTIAVKTS